MMTVLENQPITLHPISFLKQHFWSNVVRGTNSRIGLQYSNIKSLVDINPYAVSAGSCINISYNRGNKVNLGPF